MTCGVFHSLDIGCAVVKVEDPMGSSMELPGGNFRLIPKIPKQLQRWATVIMDLLPCFGVTQSMSLVSCQYWHVLFVLLLPEWQIPHGHIMCDVSTAVGAFIVAVVSIFMLEQ